MENKDKTLIRKYLNQECTPDELEEMKQLMLLPDTRIHFDEVLAENWIGLESELNIDQPRLAQKLKQFYKQLELQERSELELQELERKQIHRLKIKHYMSYAAIWIVLMLGLGSYGLYQFKKTPVQEPVVMREMVNPRGQRSTILLPDGSEVFLGAGSKLSFPQHFAVNTREITLEGEAFFQVTKNPKRPFIIHTGTVQTKVLGTSFKITAFTNQPMVVAVATGKVRVDDYQADQTKQLAVLTPGQQVTYSGSILTAQLVDVEEVKSWKNAKLNFHKRQLKEISTELERWYNVSIDYKDKAKSAEKISVTLQADQPLNKIMKVLSATGHFKYQIVDKKVFIN